MKVLSMTLVKRYCGMSHWVFETHAGKCEAHYLSTGRILFAIGSHAALDCIPKRIKIKGVTCDSDR
ncbi:hypothetical protein EII21_05825 [Conchiformibius steedae]|uniref:Uncharacterized protein n=1 Tax=Conchiformibius steedae TaxID=153493 RepID=A0A3P2A623_9NEIS|nr:hypothetical protein EII21_05825 [Conchiformibius steedae]